MGEITVFFLKTFLTHGSGEQSDSVIQNHCDSAASVPIPNRNFRIAGQGQKNRKSGLHWPPRRRTNAAVLCQSSFGEGFFTTEESCFASTPCFNSPSLFAGIDRRIVDDDRNHPLRRATTVLVQRTSRCTSPSANQAPRAAFSAASTTKLAEASCKQAILSSGSALDVCCVFQPKRHSCDTSRVPAK